MIFLKIILPLGWLVGARYCRSLCRCLVVSRRHEMRKFGWRLFGHTYTIVWLTTYIRLTARHFRHCIAWWHLPVASSTLVFHAVGRRASSFFLGPGRARATTAAVPMTLLRPASLPLPRQRLFFLWWSGGGTPFDFNYIERRHYFRYVEHYIFITAVISVHSYVRQLFAWAFSDRNDGRFVKELY